MKTLLARFALPWLATLAVGLASAANPVKLATLPDILEPSASISGMVELNGVAYFIGTSPASGAELWRSDGTPAGTFVVKDVCPGACSGADGTRLAVMNGFIYFAGRDAQSGSELWRSDGSAAGTTLVKDIAAGTASSAPGEFAVLGSTLYFAASDAAGGRELWRSDGTAVGTVLVRDLNPGANPSDPRDLTVVAGTLYFTATDSVAGRELWKSNGTLAGTVRVLDIEPGSDASDPDCLTNFNGTLLFRATTSAEGRELWKSDGTAGGTLLIEDTFAGTGSGAASCPLVIGTVAYSIGSTLATGFELWRTDGTAAGTFMVKELNAGSASGASSALFANLNGVLMFRGTDSVTGSELWRSNGTSAGTVQVANIAPSLLQSSNPTGGAVYNNVLYFAANDGTTGSELWRSDGTDAGTFLVADIAAGNASSNPSNFTVAAGLLFFTAESGVDGRELWVTDGTTFGTRGVKNLNPGTGTNAQDTPMTWTGTQLVFRGGDNATGGELWTSDGTVAGTKPLLEIDPGPSASNPGSFIKAGNRVFFTARRDNFTNLWVTDGTAGGTRLVRDLGGSGLGTPDGNRMVALGDLALFVVSGPGGEDELWRSDGTAPGTFGIRDLCPGSCSGAGVVGPVYKGAVYFSGNDGANGYELWRTDGTAAGTVLVRNIDGRVGSGSGPANYTVVGGTLFFTADNGVTGPELWKTDGTTAGTVLVKDITPGSGGTPWGPETGIQFASANGLLFFVVGNLGQAKQLWRSDGTDAGTFPLGPSGFVDRLFGAGPVLYFAVDDGTNGLELWKTDGTPAGTGLVKDIYPGPTGSRPGDFAQLGGFVYFGADDPVNGRELWRTDGTAAGTVLVADANPGPASSNPRNVVAGEDRIFFVGADPQNSTALFAYRVETPIEELAIGPVSLSFPPTGVQVTSASLPVTITNASNPAALVSGIGTDGDFLVASHNCPPSLAPGASCVVNVAFRPTVTGLRSGSLVLQTGSLKPATRTVALFGSAVANAPVVPTMAPGGTSAYGAPVTFTASVGVRTSGTLFFLDGGNFIGAAAFDCQSPPCSVSFTTRALAAGPHAITAQFLGNATFPGGTSTAIGHTVTAAGTATALLSSAPTTPPSTALTFTAIVSSAGDLVTGTVAFFRDGAPIAGCGAAGVQPDGAARCQLAGLPAGIYAITAQYGGDANNLASASNTVTQKVSVFTDTLTPSEALLDFGGQSMLTTSPPRAVAIANTSAAPLTVSAIVASAGFAVTHDCATLAPAATCTAQVTFTPTLQGAIAGSLTITATTGLQAVALSGLGERSLTTHYYRSILRRAPDAPGKAFWEGEAGRVQSAGANLNETWFAMAQAFYGSPEYVSFNRDAAAFVTDLYTTFFNRAPDAPGLGFWAGQLQQGMPREVVLAAFMFSAEFGGFTQAIFGNTQVRREIDTVTDFYRGLLGRLPDDGGLAFWIGQFRIAQCQGAAAVTAQAEAISSGFATSGEYAARARSNAQYVGDLYNAFLRRGGDLAGVQFWVNSLDTGALTREAVRQQFVQSAEFQARVQQVIAQGCLP